MFGGIGFLLNGNLACGIVNDDVLIHVGPDGHEDALAFAHTRAFDITGRVMQGWIMVSKTSCDSDEDLSTWIQHGVRFAASLPKI
jgi:hypothetical protein